MIKIGIIKPNKIDITELSYDNLNDNNKCDMFFKDYVEICELENTDNNKLLQQISEKLTIGENLTYRTYKCYETYDNTNYYIMYATTEENANIKSENDNILGRYLSEKHESSFGNCVILKTNNNKNVDITTNEITKIIKSRFIHSAVMITVDDDYRDVTYTENPVENTEIKIDNCMCYPVDFIDKTICVFIEKNPTKLKFNKLATLLCKRLRVVGDVVISMMTTFPSNEINDLHVDDLKKIICVKSNISVNPSEMIDNPLNVNFYKILNTLFEKYPELRDNIPDDVINGPTMNSTLTLT